jgi:hypothetical protein
MVSPTPVQFNDFDLISGNPDVNLVEAALPDLLPGPEERIGGRVVGVDAHWEEFVTVACATVLPGAGNATRILGDAAETVAQLLSRLIEFFRLNEPAVVIVQRQEDFEPLDPSRTAQEWEESGKECDGHRGA